MALAPGSNAGPYRIVEPLGRGGMATVYRAYEAKLNRYVALKVLPREFLHDPSFKERFHNEAKALANLEHPNVIPLYAYDIDEAEGIPWMAMRLLAAGSLADLLKRERPARARTVAILRGVAEALAYAHSKKIVHRDVKPQNVLFDEAGRVYLADFGIAKMLESSGGLTASGMITGTPQYMAPEQATGLKIGPAADIYALGIVAYEMLLGRVPFAADTPVAVLMKHVQEPLPLPRPDEIPEPMLRALLKATAKKPEDRWPSAVAFVDALAAGLAAPSAVASAPTLAIARDARTVPAAPPTVVSARTAPAPPAPAAGTAPPLPPRPPVLRPPAREPQTAPTRRGTAPVLVGLGALGVVALVVAGGAWLLVSRPGREAVSPAPAEPRASATPLTARPTVAPERAPSASSDRAQAARPAASPAVGRPPAEPPAVPAVSIPPVRAPLPTPAPTRPSGADPVAPPTPTPGPPSTAAAAPASGTAAGSPSPPAAHVPAPPAVDPEIERLARALSDPDTATRRRAAQDLAAHGPSAAPAAPALATALGDRSPDVRLRAAEALGRIGPAAQPAATRLAEALRDTDALVPAEAAKALGLLGEAAGPAAEALGAALGHKDVAVRREAARALARMGRRAEPALKALVAALSDKDKTVCAQSARALGRIGPPAGAAVPRLTALAKEQDVLVSREAQAALSSIQQAQP